MQNSELSTFGNKQGGVKLGSDNDSKRITIRGKIKTLESANREPTGCHTRYILSRILQFYRRARPSREMR